MRGEAIFVAGLGAAAGAAVLTRYVLHHHAVIDVPNERSSHVVPTPRGGGLAIAVVMLIAVVALWASGGLAPAAALALMGAAPVAMAGWVDDRHHLPVRVRLLAHTSAAVWALGWLGGLPLLRVGAETLHIGVMGWPIGVLGIVWAINFYNFMDGVDGIAGVQAMVAGFATALILFLVDAPGLGAASAALGGAAAGFLVWNWQPARIFMGDVGSATIGFLVAVLGIASERADALPLLGVVILLGPFVVDATLTLVRRLLRRERVYEAHRDHAYQRLVRAGWSHASVSLMYALAATLMALPAWLLWSRPAVGGWASLAAVVLLVGLYVAVERVHPLSLPASRSAPRP
jgi:Fuc2NAc and GlcNAc transferase